MFMRIFLFRESLLLRENKGFLFRRRVSGKFMFICWVFVFLKELGIKEEVLRNESVLLEEVYVIGISFLGNVFLFIMSE